MVDIINFTKYKISNSYFEKIIKKSLVCFKKDRDLSISLVFVGLKRMKELNYRHRKIKKPTDVLSFAYKGQKNKEYYFGEIVVCVPYAEKNAKINAQSLKKELALLITHGTLHLLGMDHERSEREAKRMKDLEIKILEKI